MISFYDFDQDHADGDRGYVRESMYVTNFTSIFLAPNTSLEAEFSPDIEARAAAASPTNWRFFKHYYGIERDPSQFLLPFAAKADEYAGGMIRVRTITDWPWTEDRVVRGSRHQQSSCSNYCNYYFQ